MTPLVALALTLAVEVPLYTVGLWGLRLARPADAALLGAGVNLLTHPVLWCSLAPRVTAGRLAAAELAVCAVEALMLRVLLRRDLPVLLALSVAANGASVIAGLLVLGRGGAA